MKPPKLDDRDFKVHKGATQAHPGSGGVSLRAIGLGAAALSVGGLVLWWLVSMVLGSDGTKEVATGQQQLNQQLLEAVEAADEASRR